MCDAPLVLLDVFTVNRFPVFFTTVICVLEFEDDKTYILHHEPLTSLVQTLKLIDYHVMQLCT